MITVVGPREPRPHGATLINTTSHGQDFGAAFSPFQLGPVTLWGGHTARNVENAWQFSKVYPDQVGPDGEPSPEWLLWARRGWADARAHRYPRGKGARPLYSWWDGARLDYIEARKRIYVPLYATALLRRSEYAELEARAHGGEHFALFDFDGYRHEDRGLTLGDVVLNPHRPMGHAFVVKLLVEHARRFDIDALFAEGLLGPSGRDLAPPPPAQFTLL